MSFVVLAKELDLTGAEVTVKSVVSIGHNPIVPVLMRNYADLIEQGYSNFHVGFANRSKAIYLEIDDKIVGHIVYDVLPDDALKTAWIQLSYVDPSFRKRGLYNIMHKYFEQTIKECGSKRIASYVHPNNTARLASCESVGMSVRFHRMEKYLD
jgi:GNAT superfamily N-acetyltransferase